jgi:prepilin-type N-terminal cleavage/methylation domain-containing protein
LSDQLKEQQMKLRKSGYSLIELLCVFAIISILAAMYFGAIAKAFIHVKKVLGH